MTNQNIRDYAKNKGVRFWEVADKMNVSEPTITRKLRYELSKEDTQKIMSIIDEIAQTR